VMLTSEGLIQLLFFLLGIQERDTVFLHAPELLLPLWARVVGGPSPGEKFDARQRSQPAWATR